MTNQFSTRFKQFAMGALVAALGASAVVIAAVFSNFQSGTTISAADMNAKLNELHALATAGTASVTCPANTPARFTDNGNGTVCDSQTGLMWEIKTGTPGVAVPCTPTDCLDAQNVNNSYTWSAATPFTEPTGTLYTNFLERLNDLKAANDGTATPCFAGHCDWRVPSIGELRSILQAPFGPTAANCTSPCIAAGFPGPTQASFYWSSSSLASDPDRAWNAGFVNGLVSSNDKFLATPARAVRGGR